MEKYISPEFEFVAISEDDVVVTSCSGIDLPDDCFMDVLSPTCTGDQLDI